MRLWGQISLVMKSVGLINIFLTTYSLTQSSFEKRGPRAFRKTLGQLYNNFYAQTHFLVDFLLYYLPVLLFCLVYFNNFSVQRLIPINRLRTTVKLSK